MLKKITTLSFYALLFYGVLAKLGGLFWYLDWPVHFMAQFTVAALAVFAALLFFQKKFHAVVLALFTLYFSLPLFLFTLPTERPQSFRTPLKILQSNINFENEDYAKLVPIIRREQPDVIALEEVRPDMLALYQRELPEYSHSAGQPSFTYNGVAILSKLPIKNFDSWTLTPETSPVIVATFDNPQFTLLAVHLLSPVNQSWTGQRDFAAQLLAERINGLTGPVAVAGDFNLTMHSSVFSNLMRNASLHNARQGYGWQPSWMVQTIFSLAIDHLLYRDAVSKDFRVLDDIGSDHRPVIATLYFN